MLTRIVRRNYSKIVSSNNIKDSITPDRFINYFLKPDYYTYIDNSEIIENVLANNSTEVLLAPRNFGKSFNLETIKYFLSSSPLVDEKVDKAARYNFFRKTKVHNWAEFNSHFASYPVISFNLKELDCNNYKDNLEKFRYMISLQYEQVLLYLQRDDYSAKLSPIDVKAIEDFFANFKNYNELALINSCKDIGKMLLKLTKHNPFYLIDDLDFPLTKSFQRGFYDDTLTLLQGLVNVLVKNNNFVNKTLISSVGLWETNALFSGVSDIRYNFHDQERTNYSHFMRQFKNDTYEDLQLSNYLKILTKDMEGMKVLADLEAKANSIINNETENTPSNNNIINNQSEKNDTNPQMNRNYLNSGIHESINISEHGKFTVSNIINFLNYNGLIDTNFQITSHSAATAIKSALPEVTPVDSVHTFDEKLNYAYWSLLHHGQIDTYFDFIKRLFEFVGKTAKKVKGVSVGNAKEVNLSFRSEKDFENYMIDVLTLDMTNEASSIKIFSIDDDDSTRISDTLKTFTLLAYPENKFAIFLRANKVKRPPRGPLGNIEAVDNQDGSVIEELMNNPNLVNKTTPKKKKFGAPNPNTINISDKLKQINEDVMTQVDKEEAVNFLMKISSDYEKVFFVSVANFEKKFDYLLEIIKLESE